MCVCTCLPIRVHELEEQIKDQETRAEQCLEEELKRHREAYSKMERDKSTEIELLSNRYLNSQIRNVTKDIYMKHAGVSRPYNTKKNYSAGMAYYFIMEDSSL